jgi:hypothetical protein
VEVAGAASGFESQADEATRGGQPHLRSQHPTGIFRRLTRALGRAGEKRVRTIPCVRVRRPFGGAVSLRLLLGEGYCGETEEKGGGKYSLDHKEGQRNGAGIRGGISGSAASAGMQKAHIP